MLEQEIIEGNKLITKFTQLRGEYDEDNDTIYLESDLDGEGVYKLSQLKYHSSWDWLMPVVEKIENFNDSCTLFIIEDERCHVNSQNGFEIDSTGHTKIEAVYNATIAFIKWYNLCQKEK